MAARNFVFWRLPAACGTAFIIIFSSLSPSILPLGFVSLCSTPENVYISPGPVASITNRCVCVCVCDECRVR